MIPKKILAIADVHIFNAKRFQEHIYLFDQLEKVLSAEMPDIIVVGGDVIDSKLRLSPEQIDICRNFFIRLANTAPVILIPGNHDSNLASKERMDSLTPIVHSIENTLFPINYIKKSGLYKMYDLNWAVWSCLEDQKSPFEDGYVKGDEYIIGLYHGVVSGAVNNTGFRLSGGIDLKEFDNCDMVIMGDIHKAQSFRNGEINYTGSFIQVNVDEDPNGTYLIYDWNGSKYDVQVKSIENIYSTIAIEFGEKLGSILPTQNLRIKFDTDTASRVSVMEKAKELKSEFNVKVDVVPMIKKKQHFSINDLKTLKSNAINSFNILDYFKDFVTKAKDKLDITDVSKDMPTLLNYETEFSKGELKEFEPGDFYIVDMKLDNFLSFYKDHNDIKLDEDGIIGIVGKNRVGKSSVIKALQFVLFNEVPNNSSAIKMINKFNRDKPAFVEVTLVKLNKIYKIRRTLTPDKKQTTVRIDLIFSEIDENGAVVNDLTKESRPYTEKEIQKYLGLNETFEMLSLFSAQKRQQEFIDCKNADRLKLVNKFLGLHSFELKEENVKERLREETAVYNTIIADFNRDTDITDLNKKLLQAETLLKLYKTNESDIVNSSNELELAYKDILLTYQNNKTISLKNIANPDETRKEIKALELENEELRKNILENVKKANDLKTNINVQSDLFTEMNGCNYNDYKGDIAKVTDIGKKIAVIDYEIAQANKQINIDLCNSCGKEFTDADKDKVREIIRTKTDEKKNLQAMLGVLQEKIDYDNSWIKKIQDAEKKIKDIEKYENIRIETTIKNNDFSIATAGTKIAEWDVVNNAKLVVSSLKDKVNEYNLEKEKLQSELEQVKENITISNMTIKDVNNKIKVYNEKFKQIELIEDKLRVLKAYRKIVSKDGLPLYILMSKIEEINEKINLIISQVFDFTIEFQVDDKKGELKIQFIYENDPEKNDVALASGSETFMINLCIKVALSQISTLPKIETVFIDEGYDSLDKDTIEKVPKLFYTLTNFYKNVITISHLDELKDMCDHQIKLEKVGRYTTMV